MKWLILAVGKLRSAYARDGAQTYFGRIGRMQPLETAEVPAARGGDGPEAEARMRRQEAERLLGRIGAGDHVILLDERGAGVTSEGLAKKIGALEPRVRSRLVFIVGGAFGVDASVRERADEVLSLGPMTFPHELARVVLAEQLYRALTIQRNIPYHHR